MNYSPEVVFAEGSPVTVTAKEARALAEHRPARGPIRAQSALLSHSTQASLIRSLCRGPWNVRRIWLRDVPATEDEGPSALGVLVSADLAEDQDPNLMAIALQRRLIPVGMATGLDIRVCGYRESDLCSISNILDGSINPAWVCPDWEPTYRID